MIDPQDEPLKLNTDFYADFEDFTFFHRLDELHDLLPEGLEPAQVAEIRKKTEWDETICLRPRSQSTGTGLNGRLHVSRCYGGKYLSCSFRAAPKQNPIVPSAPYHLASYNVEKSKYNPDPPEEKGSRVRGQTRQKSYLTTMKTMCDVIGDEVLERRSQLQGIIIVSGATAAGKSQIARGLIYAYLQTKVGNRGERRPHLITYEDPIDVLWADNPEEAKETGIDYTPCEAGEGKDVALLKDALEAALRQTPSVFFVGETRRPADWKELVRFASTGHLAITTSHAGSLTEAMGQLLRATKADNPALRSEIVKRLVAVIHLRSGTFQCEDAGASGATVSYTLPAIWTKTPSSTKAFMSDGLTSLLPYRDKAGALGCLGRTWFAEKLLQQARRENFDGRVRTEIEAHIRQTALCWDLEGI